MISKQNSKPLNTRPQRFLTVGLITVAVVSVGMFSLEAVAAPKKSVAAKNSSTIEQSDEAPLNAKLVVDSAGEAEAITEAKIEHGSLALPSESHDLTKTSQNASGKDTVGVTGETLSKPDVAKLPENSIPVLTGAKDVKKASGNGFNRILTTLGVLALVLGGLTFALKRLAARKSAKNENTKIRVITQHALGPKKSLAIIQVAGESILVGITDQNISMLKTLALIDDEFPNDLPKKFENALNDMDFEDEVPSAPIRTKKRDSQFNERDDFAMKGLSEIRDKVSTRFKNNKNY